MAQLNAVIRKIPSFGHRLIQFILNREPSRRQKRWALLSDLARQDAAIRSNN